VDAFALECQALKRVREGMGLDNLKIMVPFCRRLSEARAVLEEMALNGLTRGENGLEVVKGSGTTRGWSVVSACVQFFSNFCVFLFFCRPVFCASVVAKVLKLKKKNVADFFLFLL